MFNTVAFSQRYFFRLRRFRNRLKIRKVSNHITLLIKKHN